MEADPAAVANVETNYASLLFICDVLETIADGLPANVGRQECLILSRVLVPMFRHIQDYEEQSFFPILLASNEIEIGATIARLRREHQMDSAYAEDVQDMLRNCGENRPGLAADAAGFMLRGFFDSVRRHVAFEQSMLAPLLRANATS